jgi:hypothetical protein
LERRQRLQRPLARLHQLLRDALAGTRLKHHPSRAGLTIDTKAGPVWTGEVRFNDRRCSIRSVEAPAQDLLERARRPVPRECARRMDRPVLRGDGAARSMSVPGADEAARADADYVTMRG